MERRLLKRAEGMFEPMALARSLRQSSATLDDGLGTLEPHRKTAEPTITTTQTSSMTVSPILSQPLHGVARLDHCSRTCR